MSVNTKMTAIADLIRTLTGASGKLTLDQMAQALTGANGDVTSALTALTEKGVDTTGAALSDIAGLVESIQAGGGELRTVSGQYTVAQDTQLTNNSYYTIIEHNAGFEPLAFVLYHAKSSSNALKCIFAIRKDTASTAYQISHKYYNSTTNTKIEYGNINTEEWTDTEVKWYVNGIYYFYAGTPVKWIVFG